MITKFAALQALDDSLVRRLNHLCDVYFLAVAEPEAILRFMHGIELAGKDYRKAKQALDDARNLAGDDD